MSRSFVLIQPGCDQLADDVAVFGEEDLYYIKYVKYVVDRGGDPEFFKSATVGDAMRFDRERVVLCVGKIWGVK
jgi:hypothetical protein